MRAYYLLVLILISASLWAQSDTVFNQTDAKGLKQGFWKKNYPNGKIMYAGYFKDNKPTGLFKRYFESGSLKALMSYDETGEYAHTKLFYEDGNLAATGNYFGSEKDSLWTYYSYYDQSVTSKETYIKGALHGISLKFYNDGSISEKIEWQNNKKSGIWEQYFKGNVPKLKAQYLDNKLEGKFLVNNEKGNLYMEGSYHNNLREGKWIFYKEDGSVQNELNYKAGIAPEESQLTAGQQDFFRMIDESMGKFEEPDETNFLSPPAK